MKITLKRLNESLPALKEFGALALRPVVAKRVAHAIRFARGENEDFESARDNLLNQCAVKDDKGNMVREGQVVPLADPAKFTKGEKELLAEEIEIPPGVKPIKISELDCNLKGEWLYALDWLIVEDEEKPAAKPAEA